jgi:hypothetical protein
MGNICPDSVDWQPGFARLGLLIDQWERYE